MDDANDKEGVRAKNVAYRYLSYRPRSHAEVEKKLRDKGFGHDAVRTVLSQLVRLGYIDDEKFADQWVQSRVRLRGLGRHRIERELRDKGVDRETVRRALAGVLTADVETETARKAAKRKLTMMKDLDRETRRRRIAGFLERKGFSHGVIWDILKNTD
ncbi:MAG TPA: regulatory protein RecX [Bacteroidota bacterium]|nr:regulatory protein RecX [Bacteroidota bacterium]HXY54182.1 regulatory protein RecX [Nitrospirota bacterium]